MEDTAGLPLWAWIAISVLALLIMIAIVVVTAVIKKRKGSSRGFEHF